ncbi:MAG TPA: flagellar basal body P-ring formation chaperone FlgA [Caulobacteraceae bacterium]|jgi:flagella basal body P-ring formation protein FlgA|nr:flagellar basal body P-ring formation chaperone FlgA [Caulobacteraceae bacterium]
MRGLSLIGVLLALALAAPARAGQPVSLRDQVSASGSITLGDLFDNAGAAAGVVIGNGAPVGLSAVLDAGAVQRIARNHGLDWDNPQNLQRLLVPSVGGPVAAGGHMVEVLTYTRSLAAGEVVQPTDLAFGKVASFAVPADAPRDAEGVIGKVARRPLRSGAAVAAHDLGNAILVKRDDLVEVSYHSDGIDLTLQGKAMADAAAGEPVAIQNTTSKKVIQAVVSGPDQAVVGPQAEAVRAAAQTPSQFAALP